MYSQSLHQCVNIPESVEQIIYEILAFCGTRKLIPYEYSQKPTTGSCSETEIAHFCHVCYMPHPSNPSLLIILIILGEEYKL